MIRSISLVAALATTAGLTQELKVDLNNNRPISEGNETGPSLTVQPRTGLISPWGDWTTSMGSGVMQLLPLNELTNQSPRYFRAFAQ